MDSQIRYVADEGALTTTLPEGREVVEGVTIAFKAPPGEGAPGTTVLGETLPGRTGRDLSLHAYKGKNLRVSDDGQALIATARGIVSVCDERVQVENTLLLDRDVTAGTGRIEFPGDIVVKGSVGRGVSLTAGGNITIEGKIDVAVVQAGGHVWVGGGIHGRGMGTVRAGGNVSCRFMEEARVQAGGDVSVEDDVRSSQVTSERRVLIGGSVTGGQVYGVGGVKARTAGSSQGVPTILIAGVTQRARDEAERLRLRSAVLVERAQAVETIVADLVGCERANNGLAPDRRLVALKAVEERARLRAETARLHKRRAEIALVIENPQPAVIAVSQKAHRRTRVLIDEAALELTADTQYAHFSRDFATSTIRLSALS